MMLKLSDLIQHIKEYPISYSITSIICLIFIFNYSYIDIKYLSLCVIFLFIGILSLCISINFFINYLKNLFNERKHSLDKINIQKETNKKIYNNIKYIVNNEYSEDFKNLLFTIIYHNLFNDDGICNVKIINIEDDNIKNILTLKNKYDTSQYTNGGLYYVEEKEQSNEYKIYIDPIVIKLLKEDI